MAGRPRALMRRAMADLLGLETVPWRFGVVEPIRKDVGEVLQLASAGRLSVPDGAPPGFEPLSVLPLMTEGSTFRVFLDRLSVQRLYVSAGVQLGYTRWPDD